MIENDATVAALHALRERGVDHADRLLADYSTDEILLACAEFDRRQGVTPGIIVHWLREGIRQPPPAPRMTEEERNRGKWDEAIRRLPVGALIESHRDYEARCWRTEVDCSGWMLVHESSSYPTLVLVCDKCNFDAGVPVRFVHLLPDPVPELEALL